MRMAERPQKFFTACSAASSSSGLAGSIQDLRKGIDESDSGYFQWGRCVGRCVGRSSVE